MFQRTVMVATDGGAAIRVSIPSPWCIPDSHRLGLMVLLGKHELGDLDWRGHRAPSRLHRSAAPNLGLMVMH